MTLKKMFMLTIGLVVVFSGLLVFTYARLVTSQNELMDAYEYQKDAIVLSDTMSQSSEDLTNSIRLYAMTGDRVYRDIYFNTLDISNGKAPRPDGSVKAFSDMVEAMNLTTEESDNILKSSEYSMNLVTLETEVMEYVDQWLTNNPFETYITAYDPQLRVQQTRLFSREYMDEIDKIMQPVVKFQSLLMERVATHIDDSLRMANAMKFLFIISMSILVIFVIVVLALLSRYITGNIKRVVQVIEKIAAGDISDRLVASARNEFGFMATSINTMAETIGLVVGEARMLTTAAVEGRLSTRSEADKFKGGFHDIVEGVNQTLDAVIGPLNVAAGYVDRISKGDIPPRITDTYNGDFNTIKNNLNVCVDAVNALVADAGMLAQAAVEGRLQTRADATRHQGDFRKIVDGVNKTLDLVIDPINETIAILKRMAEGDLTPTMTGSYQGDFDVLKTALNNTLAAINDLLGQVTLAVGQVTTGSQQVSQASQALSQGATEQASSLEEITSSITEVAGQTKQNTENAMQVNGLAKKARDDAEQGNEQMKDLVSAMTDINSSAEEIRKIVKAIDDISFQINLLALNANVEAARAGKYGKGFAVVAEEVRNLAVRSAGSVQDTTRMVDEAISNINRGNGLVDVTAKQLQSIVSGAAQVASLAEQVAVAGKEQSQGLEQISAGLNQIDQVTQANTASAEQSASAAEELSSQSQQLKAMLARFKLAARESQLTNDDVMRMLQTEMGRQGLANRSGITLRHDAAQAPVRT